MPPQTRNPADQSETPGEPNAVPNATAAPKGSREPEHQDIVPGTTDTTIDHGKVRRTNSADVELLRLADFLDLRFPNVAVMTPNGPEGTVDTAMRLLEQLATYADVARCPESFCNKPKGHLDEHGWVERTLR